MYSIYFSPVPQATPVSNTIAVWCLLEESFFFFFIYGVATFMHCIDAEEVLWKDTHTSVVSF